MRILLVKPSSPARDTGNDTTAERWTRLLRELEHQVAVAAAFDGQPCDALIALHALKTSASSLRFRGERPEAPLLVALTGTDVYGEIAGDDQAQRVLDAADCLIELQPLARRELPEALRGKTRTILQSSLPAAEPGTPRDDRFEACVIGHLRRVKDPFRAAEAARLLPQESRVHVLHVGAALDDGLEQAARDEQEANPRYTWLGGLSRDETLRVLTRSRVLVLSSRSEGGANVVSEALVNDVPVLGSRIPGTVGLLGDAYPGYFEVGDTEALSRLLWRFETDTAFRNRLRDCCRFIAPRFDPDRERDTWRRLLEELSPEAPGG